MIEKFTNQYSLSKTLRFSLIPVGKTEENFNKKLLLEEDTKRAEDYQKVKGYIDRYHKAYIDRVLSSITVIEDLEAYAELYYKSGKADSDNDDMEKLEAKMRKQISKALKSGSEYKKLKSKEMITELLPSFLSDEEELEITSKFAMFTTYFSGFFSNRENMYTEEDQSTAISYRCINDNLPKFLDNVKGFAAVKANLPASDIDELNETFYSLKGKYLTDIFNVDYFPFALAQSGIDTYNQFIGGYTCTDGTKVKGLNEYINLYNQQVAKSDKSKRLPLMKVLYKQILSDRETVSFIPEKFENDNEVVSSINSFLQETALNTIASLKELFESFDAYNMNGIFISSGLAVTDLSNAVFGDWSAFVSAWESAYEASNPKKKNKSQEKYDEEMKAAYKAIKSFSLSEIQEKGFSNLSKDDIGSVSEYYKFAVSKLADEIYDTYQKSEALFTGTYSEIYDKKLIKNNAVIEQIKNMLDAVKALEKLVKPLCGTGKEEEKDDVFYGAFLPLFAELSAVDRLYDKVRNYVTQKPYSKDKIKLNFENPQFLNGWDKNKERDYRSVLLRKDGNYYLAVMDKSNNKIFMDVPESDGNDCFEKMDYKLLPGPNKMLPKVFFAKSNLDTFAPSEKVLEIRSKESFKKGDTFNVDDCHEFIDFYKKSIAIHPDWSQFGFEFSPTEAYNDISEFYREVSDEGYKISFTNVACSYINSFVEKGQLYLFQIYNKDFSEHSHGTPNLHTLYFKALFDEKNLSDVVFKLNGEAEMFYRKASIKDSEKITHPANVPIDNKNPDNPKKQSVFDYELVKDNRFTKRQFSIHIPITINYKAHGREVINNDVRYALKSEEHTYAIGIDRGERNLIYISVVNEKGEIVEQMSLNEIIGDNGYKVDYQKLLDKKEKERDEARKSWGSVENIKELKEGYLSQVVHKICELVVKYDAVVIMEDLNFGFKRGRFNVEKQVYQKFENMLISKMNYLCDKKADPEADGGLLKAYQLTNKFDGVNKGKQNGIIFYVPAWNTSKIDPVTGFTNLLHPKYTSVESAKAFFDTMDDIRYNSGADMFEFDIDYSKFPKCNANYRKKWTICTNGDRIETFRNPAKNNEWDNRKVNLTQEFKALFNEFGVDFDSSLKASILKISNKEFYYRLTKLFALTLQMRNSVTGSTNPEDDYLISPVKGADGTFYDSRNFIGVNAILPTDADANGAYNIARKGLWAINKIKNTPDDELSKVNLAITNAEWLEYVQS